MSTSSIVVPSPDPTTELVVILLPLLTSTSSPFELGGKAVSSDVEVGVVSVKIEDDLGVSRVEMSFPTGTEAW